MEMSSANLTITSESLKEIEMTQMTRISNKSRIGKLFAATKRIMLDFHLKGCLVRSASSAAVPLPIPTGFEELGNRLAWFSSFCFVKDHFVTQKSNFENSYCAGKNDIWS